MTLLNKRTTWRRQQQRRFMSSLVPVLVGVLLFMITTTKASSSYYYEHEEVVEEVKYKIPDLSKYGYQSSWLTEKSGFVVNPSLMGSDDAGYVVYKHIPSVKKCARVCHNAGYPAGEYGYPSMCTCFSRVECREPSMVIEGAVTFISDSVKPPICEKSYCDYVKDPQSDEFCHSKKLYRKHRLDYIPPVPEFTDLTKWGYEHQWLSEHDGFPLAKPVEDPYKTSSYPKPYYYGIVNRVRTVKKCAKICYAEHAISGGYDYAKNKCYCNYPYYKDDQSYPFEYCSEPSILIKTMIIFSQEIRPDTCNASYCDYYGKFSKNFCKEVARREPIVYEVPEVPQEEEHFVYETTPEYAEPVHVDETPVPYEYYDVSSTTSVKDQPALPEPTAYDHEHDPSRTGDGVSTVDAAYLQNANSSGNTFFQHNMLSMIAAGVVAMGITLVV